MSSNSDIKELVKKRDLLKKRFEAEKTGEQMLFTNQEKLFKPIIESQKEASKAIIETNQDILNNVNNALVPFTNEIMKRNQQLEMLQDLPFYNIQPGIEHVPQSTPQKDRDIIIIDLDEGLNVTDRENLEDLKLDLPSVVQKEGSIKQTLDRIKTTNSSLAQLGREDYLAKKPNKQKEKEIINSQKETLKRYKNIISSLEGAQKFIPKSGQGLQKQRKLCKPKRGRGRPKKYHDVILYNNTTELCEKLNELDAAKRAGNTGLDNSINSILDELLNIKCINKDGYDKLYKNIFN